MCLRRCDGWSVMGAIIWGCCLGWAQEGSQSSQPAQPSGARLELSPAIFDFGEIWQGEPASQVFTVKNVGTAPLTLEVNSGCGCTVATKPRSPLEPGQSSTFSITYNTQTYTGWANRRATVRTNDPTQPTVTIPIKGNVKPLFETSPLLPLSMNWLTLDSVETATVKLVNKYESPIHLKLKPGQDFGPFNVELKEVRPGSEYVLSVTTRPPLKAGFNRITIVLETGLERSPVFEVPVNANAQPRVLTVPSELYVTAASSQPSQQRLRVQYRLETPIKIVSVEVQPASIQYELLPPDPKQAGHKVGFHDLRITLPPFEQLPDDAKVVIRTDDPSPQYQVLEVPIVKRDSLIQRAVGKRPPGSPRPIQLEPKVKSLEGEQQPQTGDDP